ncbi:single-stranded DNA cytosine deaminase-like [Huso huso]|uniref:Single-stranded DNA cytosine deaminase-like n=1 Tax=Huso huso TaxID=61971 RepID=A0ABR0Y7I8_HUSHU
MRRERNSPSLLIGVSETLSHWLRWLFVYLIFSSSFIKMKRIPDDVFTFQFENLQLATGRHDTWLCQIRSVNGGEADLQVFNNEDSGHAEEICLRENEAAIKKADRSEITWYLSWSSCGTCASQIIEFVEKHPNVKLNIFVSRLYYCEEPDNLASKTHEKQTEIKQKIKLCREGLGNLKQHERIDLKVMTLNHFQDCFDRFVEFKPWEKLEEDSQLHAEKLKEITGADPRLAFETPTLCAAAACMKHSSRLPLRKSSGTDSAGHGRDPDKQQSALSASSLIIDLTL